MMAVSVSAASFKFTFNGSGTDYSNVASKGNKSFAAVTIGTAPNCTYKYAVAKGVYTGYVTDWKNKTGTGGVDLSYNISMASGTTLRLHGATVSNCGTSTVSGTWTP